MKARRTATKAGPVAAGTDPSFAERLLTEVERWRGEGLISEELARAIAARYAPGRPSRLLRLIRLNLLVSAVAVVGAVTLGAGVILFVAANWDRASDWLTLALVGIAMIALYAGGFALRFHYRTYPQLGEALMLAGSLLYMAGVFLVAQMYNIPVASPELLLVGSLGALPIAYLGRAASVLLPALAAFAAWLVWRSGMGIADTLQSDVEIYVFVVAVGMLIIFACGLTGMAELHRRWGETSDFRAPYLIIATMGALAGLLFFTFGDFWHEVADNPPPGPPVPDVWLWTAAVGAVAALAASALTAREDADLRRAEAGAGAAVITVCAVAMYQPSWAGYAILFNIVYFAVALGVTARGYLEARSFDVYIGLLAIGVGLVVRYSDWFWDVLPRSAFFIAGGLVLLAVAGALERLRRRLMASWVAGEAGRAA